MKKYLKYIVIGALFFLFAKNELEILVLKFQGNVTQGTVSKVYKVGSKGTVMMNYYFKVDNNIFESEGYLNTLEEAKEGDTIDILFLKKYPNINCNKRHIDSRW